MVHARRAPPGRYDADQIRRLSDTTIAYYDRFARAFWDGTRHHDVSQNYAAFLNAIEGDPPDADHAEQPLTGSDASIKTARALKVRFAHDSPLEGEGFELSVPHRGQPISRPR
jgi:hypothetical protein